MRSTIRLVIIIALALTSLPEPHAGISRTTTAQQLSQIEQQLAKAAVAGDIDTYSSILAADWTTIDLAGRVLSKSQVIQEMSSKERRIEEATIDDVRVREMGRVAVVTGRTTLTGSYQGKRVTVVLRFTDVFTKRDGRWQVVASQGTQVMK